MSTLAQKKNHTKTLKPLYWSLFGAGGMIAALILPILIILLGFVLPFGLFGDGLGFYYLLHRWFSQPIIFLGIAGSLFLILWHCVHRFYYCLHDCQIHVGMKTRWGLYTFALCAFAITIWCGW